MKRLSPKRAKSILSSPTAGAPRIARQIQVVRPAPLTQWIACRPAIAIALLLLVLWWINPNWTFQNLGNMDPWMYFGDFHHFPELQNLLPEYQGERLTWVLPGLIFVRVFGAVAGVVLLHCACYAISLRLFYAILRELTCPTTAFFTTILLGCHPFFIGANGWDYSDSASVLYQLLSLACLIRAGEKTPPNRWLFFSAAGWWLLVFNYLAWAAFTPGYLLLLLWPRRNQQPLWRTVGLLAAQMSAALLAVTVFLAGAYHALGAKGVFFAISLRNALFIANLANNPWLTPGWYREAVWLVFPAIGCAAALVGMALDRWGRAPISAGAHRILAYYLYCSTAMVVLTVRPTRLGASDYFASILIPGAFLALGICLYRVPDLARPRLFWPVLMGGTAICLAPLSRPELFRALLHWHYAVVAGSAVVVSAGLRWMWPKRPAFWAAATLSLSALSFPLVPAHSAAAWRMEYRGWDVSARLAEAVDLIWARLPKGSRPVFWFNNYTDPLTSEYRGIWSAFHASGPSMLHYPEVDPLRHYPPGTRVVVLDRSQDVAPTVQAMMGRAGMPVALVAQDRVSRGGTTYWVSHFDVLR